MSGAVCVACKEQNHPMYHRVIDGIDRFLCVSCWEYTKATRGKPLPEPPQEKADET